MPYYAQQTNVWCWAAAAQMVIGAYTGAPNQCQVASVALYGSLNYNVCCANPGLCESPGPMSWIANTVYIYSGRVGVTQGGPLSFAQIKASIDICSPIVVLYSNSFSGHFVVIQGYNDAAQSLSIYDPFLGVFSAVPYGSSFAYAGPGQVWGWYQSLYNFQ